MSEKTDDKNKFSYGGQALIEGVMMRGRNSAAVAVREPSGNIAVECKRAPDVKKSVWYRVPVVRGVFNFISSLVLGFKTLMRSAEAAGEEDEQLGKGGMALAVVLALALFIGLFIFLPRVIASALEGWLFPDSDSALLYSSVIESVTRIIIFIIYLWVVSLMKDIKRTYMYHGAEHKTINAYEKGGELTVESVRAFSTRHNRCGTTFLFFVIVISILVFTLVTWALTKAGLTREALGGGFLYNLALMGIRLAMLPLVAGLSYELLRLLAKGKDSNIILKILRAPGLALQGLTTKAPDDAMLEVAIASLKAAQAMDADPSMADYEFELTLDFKKYYDGKKQELATAKADEAALDWLCCDILNIKRPEIQSVKIIKRTDGEKITKACDRLKIGQPLQYIQGYTEFCGYRFGVDNTVLIPRPETELLVGEVVKFITDKTAGERGDGGDGGDGGAVSLLDLCCGSGCIGIAAALSTGCGAVLSDISADALKRAEENAKALNAQNVSFVQSDMFSALCGTYDIITCNPPYIKSADIETLSKTVKDYEPKAALDGGADGLEFYRVFSEGFAGYLKDGGAAFLELGAGQADDVKALFKDFITDTVNDYNGIERVLIIKKMLKN